MLGDQVHVLANLCTWMAPQCWALGGLFQACGGYRRLSFTKRIHTINGPPQCCCDCLLCT